MLLSEFGIRLLAIDCYIVGMDSRDAPPAIGREGWKMYAKINSSGLILSTVRAGMDEHHDQIRPATVAECVEVLRSIPINEISANPAAYQALAVGIARGAWVGSVGAWV
jgi:hypothetical protein